MTTYTTQVASKLRKVIYVAVGTTGLLFVQMTKAQEARYQVKNIAFYNVENLFDIIDDSLKFDESRTPDGKDRWTRRKYDDKIEKISFTIAQIGRNITQTSPDIIGLCEIENESVLLDLIKSNHLREYNYGIIHTESPDIRGIDVAFLYKKSCFIPQQFESHPLKLISESGEREYTRDQLLVTGRLDGEKIHFIINHWPSRRGGEIKSAPKRAKAAKLNRKLIDSLMNLNISAKIITMGDFNDDPNSRSIQKVLNTGGHLKRLKEHQLFNPMYTMFKAGFGSLAYRDKWNLFDQIILTPAFLKDDETFYTFWKAGIFNSDYLISREGRYKGYPFRSYANGNYTGGYSDHFPVYIYLIKKAP
ncbi:endonuclease/exonuclease/phosphatase family protein [Zhouia amylolytica]|nr:endonuclease/exonuclease/phosphatase family protein [Zhouia amylolytica]